MTQVQPMQSDAGRPAWLGENHGYRIAGDVACLNAELACLAPTTSDGWALQLWACEEPYRGGALSGTKVAEALLEPPRLDAAQPQHLYAETFARLPAGDREYSMVLVLAKRSQDAREEVLDYANYPAREHFSVPSLQGAFSHSLSAQQLNLRVERIYNPRSSENLSGTLALELWALSEPYTGGQFQGQALAGVELGRLAGQGSLEALERVLPFSAAPAANACLTLMLREWTANGYVTRDYRNLASPRPAAMIAAPQHAAEAVLSDLNTPENAVPAPEAAPASQPVAAAAESRLVSIRHATLEELARVPGLNRKLAAEIIKTRPYSSLDQLLKVRGIGDKTLRKLRSVLAL